MELNRIYNEDCLEGMKRIPDGSVDMILCDLPYGTTRNEWDSIIPLESLWVEYSRVIKENGAIVLTAQTPFDKILGMSNIKQLKYEWIWEKDRPSGHLNANRMPMKSHENILVFYDKPPTYNPQKSVGHKPMNISYGTSDTNNNWGKFEPLKTIDKRTTRFPRSNLYFNTVNTGHGIIHPTQKPVPLFEYLIKTYTNKNETVLDNCMGSGTTAIACMNTERNFIGFELDKTYYKKSLERIKNHATQTDIFDVLEGE